MIFLIKRRFIIFILIIGLLCSCNTKNKYEYSNTNAGKDTFLIVGKDTFPSLARLIKIYLKQNIDSTNVLLPDSKIALKFARLILNKRFGEKLMDSEEPFKIELIDNKFWYIVGYLPPNYAGGVAEIMISKYDCKVLYLMHGK